MRVNPWNPTTLGNVSGWISLPSDSGTIDWARVKARGHFERKLWKHKLWITVALLDYEINICGSQTLMTAICTSAHVCHVMLHYLHYCTELKFTVSLIHYFKATVMLNFIFFRAIVARVKSRRRHDSGDGGLFAAQPTLVWPCKQPSIG